MKNNNELKLSVPPHLFPVTFTNGPGLRYVMWVQGCSIRCCTDCLNPELHDPAKGVIASVDQVLAQIFKVKENIPIEGITVLGGEPTDQVAALSQLLPGIREQGLSVMLYTGHQLEKLAALDTGKGIHRLMQFVDLLVEGNYNPQLDFPGTLWRGSVNQRIFLLSPYYDVNRLKDILGTTAREMAGKIDVIEYPGGSRLIRKHWGEPLPIRQAHERKGLLPQQEEAIEMLYNGRRVTSWLPELASAWPTGNPILSPKGITGVLDVDNRLHLFGFQKKEVVQQFKYALRAQGIKLNFETDK
jgi:anaerobic ribonucleoside-triphosphate reductase activating protein